jgi:hypothetical protein
MSTENSPYPDKVKLNISHEEAVQKLSTAGTGKVLSIDGSYGNPERSIFISNPSDKQVDMARQLAHMTGQESHIESDGVNHKMLFNHGDRAGQVETGTGTDFYPEQPDDFYSRLPDGTFFTHRFGKSEKMNKGARGDWKKEGYTLKHQVIPEVFRDKHTGFVTHHVTALSPSGQEVGHYQFSQWPDEGGDSALINVNSAQTHPEHKRKGLASAAYSLIEQKTSRKIGRQGMQTKEASALWSQPNRPFGKSEKIPGGMAEEKTNKDFPKLKILQGRKVEMEHTSSPQIADEIARDHLSEDPNYYDKLKTIETKKSEPLMKPYTSEAQRRWAHTPAGIKALGGKEAVRHWDKESKGKDLPEKIDKSNYGPKKLDLYSQADNARRKMSRAGEEIAVGPNAAVRLAGPTKNKQAEMQARIDRQKSKKNPVKIYSKEERKKLAEKKGLLAASELAKKDSPSISNPAPQVNINPAHGKYIADAYHNMKHDPEHPEVKAAYGALIDETKKQFKDMLDQGFKFTSIKPNQANPYKTSKDLHADIKQNKHMHFFPTDQGFGPTDSKTSNHPMLQPTEFKHEGKPLLANDLFRIVHDFRGHHLGGESSFGPKGEHQAYLTHKKDFSPLAQKALATETMGQNQWVNFGPHGENNRKNPNNTVYAEQKAGLLPDSIINGRWHE